MPDSAAVLPLYTSSMPIHNQVNGTASCQRLYDQKAIIRAKVRKVFAQRGYDGMQMRYLAKQCGVSLQTIYNNFGGREEVVCSAIGELLKFQLIRASNESRRTNKNFLLYCCDQTIELLETDWAYMHAIYSALNVKPTGTLVSDNIQKVLLQTYIDQLQLMRQRGGLKQWVNIEQLAKVCQNAMNAILYTNWHENIDIKNVNQQLKLGIGLPLLGAACGAEAKLIEESLQAY